jgi:2-polyprenyl-3-methyl-5-hydroxy-6-metoxy-1,4-benzoquinol methylase
VSGSGANEIVEIRKEEVKACYLCGNIGSNLYGDLTDRLFGAPGRWGFLQCEFCGLVWLSPRPVPADLSRVYETYFTHPNGNASRGATFREKMKRGLYSTVPGNRAVCKSWVWNQAGNLLALVPSMRERACLGVMHLDGGVKGKLLDVGCGNGEFLTIMRDAGWNVSGVEPDPAAAKIARNMHGILVTTGNLGDAKLPANSFDAITLSHVIEHVYDPVGLLRECRRVLTQDGKLIMTTPNVAGQGHQTFQKSWVALDPPRHLYLFSPSTLQTCCDKAGLTVRSVRSSSRVASWTWAASKTIARKGTFLRKSDQTLGLRLQGLAFQMRQDKSRRLHGDVGEELVIICSR